MPHKIAFIVISSSGREDGFSAKELMVHAPTVNGWRSARFCQYPQEIILQMVERCRIRKLQLLAHQYLISSKIEFYITESLPEYFAPYQSERFRRLGYVSLSDNEKTGYKARELKSVYVDAVGQYLKLVFHKNYVNRYNLYNQVALVAINIIGDAVDYNDESNTLSRGKVIDHYLGSSSDDPALDGTNTGKLDSISPLDDLAFDMYQDPEVAQIIRKLDETKQEAVKNERYDYAKKLKQAIADLQKVGERLGRYEVEKRCAVEKEDYSLAKQKKEQMEEYRLKVYQQLELHNLLDVGQIRRPPELPLEPVEHLIGSRQQEQVNLPQHKREKSTERKSKREPLATEHPAKRNSPKVTSQPQSPSPPALRPIQVLPKISIDALPYDERPLPALRKLQGEVFASPELEPEEESISDTSRSGITGEPEPLTEKSLREASFAIEVFGEALVAGAYSKTWSYREDALLAVYKKLWEMPTSASKEELKSMLRAAIFLTQRAMKDNVSSVFHASLKLLKMIVTQYIPKHKLGKLETTHCLERTLPNLISRTGDSATRLRVVASNFIQELALFKEIKPLQIVPAYLVQPLKQTCPARLAHSQVELVECLVKELGTVNSGFTVDNIMRFAVRALEHSAFEVREVAVRIILDLYKQHQHNVLEFLPPDDATTRKNVLYKTLYDGFAKIDGRPSDSEIKAQKKAAVDEAEKQKKEEIRALQEQLAALKFQTELQAGKAQKKAATEDLEKQKKEETRALHEQLATLKENQAEAPAGKEKEADLHKSKSGGKNAANTMPLENADDRSSVANYLDKLCIFCGERDESFTEEGLDLHYWKHCPMLKRCEHCKQVVEIASLTEHLLTECDRKDKFGKCPLCCEAIPKEELAEHIKAKTCTPAKPEKVANRCPLCHENFTPGEEAWKFHLMGKDGCKMNLRRTPALQRTQPLQHGKAGGLAVPKPGIIAPKMRSPASGSKIPAPRAGLNKTTGKAQPS
ncbi:centrosomal protein of 104 kDa isoform X2 [Rhinatrema bivittatum]|uniref:centrosomal protein of 104 kDa isoform X2 n=1 Tax=Rhinatrema bivittatum TaxID=194408 RepID=UPI00112D412D|nr:centrosomal protein of 104 kDa isoform X2 [Rhinatrema bivittatum]